MNINGRAAWGPDDAPLFIVLGQSNSYGHNTLLPPEEQIPSPGLNNVFTLSQSNVYSIDFSEIIWKGLTTSGDANIGTPVGSTLGNQNNPVNAANRFGALWQNHINSGNNLGLPDLYVILMGWGAQGMYEETTGDNRWSPDRNESDVESLYPRALRTLRMAINSLRVMGKNPRIISIQWNQWESETLNAPAAMASAMNFNRIVSGINDALGSDDIYWHFFYPLAQGYYAENTKKVIQALESVVETAPTRRAFIDPRNAPHYTGVAPNFGIFGPDNVHYNAKTHQWFAQLEWNKIISGYKGLPLSCVPYRNDQYWLNKKLNQKVYESISEWHPNFFSAGLWLDHDNPKSGLRFFDSSGFKNAWIVTNEQGKKAFKAIALSGDSSGNCMVVPTASATDGKYGYFEMDLFCSPVPEITVCSRVQISSKKTYGNIGYGYIAIQLSGAYSDKPQYMPSNISPGKTIEEASPYLMIWNLSAPLNIRSVNFDTSPSDGIYNNTPVFGKNLNAAKLLSGWPKNTWSRWRIGMLPENNGTISVEWYDAIKNEWEIALQQRNMNLILNESNTLEGQFSILSGMSSEAKNVEQQNTLYNQLISDISFISMD